ncbi:helix-turn-helix domain-containing protein [bacterium]|nr:helix-turn-helix domain-containing protein [bacterium]
MENAQEYNQGRESSGKDSRSALLAAKDKVKELPSEQELRAEEQARKETNRQQTGGSNVKPVGFWTVSDVAQYLGLTDSTIYTWAQQGDIPHIKLGRMVRFRRSDIEKWLESQTVGVNDTEDK